MVEILDKIDPIPAALQPANQFEFTATARAAAFIDLYRRTYEAIRYEADLSPLNKSAHGEVLKLLRALRQPFSDSEIRQITFHPDVRALGMVMRRLIAKAETATERLWSQRLDTTDLANFCLFRDYDRQIENELTALGYPHKMPPLKDKHRILIVGAGPLPIDAILLHQKIGKRITCIDSDKKTAELGRALIQRLGYSHAIEYIHAAADMYGYENHPLAFMHNEVSNNFGVLNNIVEVQWVEQLAIRSARGIYSLLYTPFPPDVAAHFKLKFTNFSWETSETLQATLFANVLKSPDRIVKPGKKSFTANEIYPFTLAEQQKAQLQGHSLIPLPN